MSEIPSLIKGLAMAAIEQEKPVSVIIGTVTDVSGLRVETEQKLVIEEDFIIFPKRFYNYEWVKGEGIILLRCDGGQRYLILDVI